jgi:transglutaminase-like putative cysteine protease
MGAVPVTVVRALVRDAGRRIVRAPKAVRLAAGLTRGGWARISQGGRSVVLRIALGDRLLIGRQACRLSAALRTELQVLPGATVTLEGSAEAALAGSIDTAHYDLVVVERRVANPFQVSPRLMEIAASLVAGRSGSEGKARALFMWVQRHVRYGASRRRGNLGYRDSLEVKNDGEGVCGEQAYLYVSMARLAGLRSNFVVVKRDHRGQRVAHACASVEINGQVVLVDPAYHTFGIVHQDFEVVDDLRAHEMFVGFRGHRS